MKRPFPHEQPRDHPPQVARHVPRWSEVKPLLGLDRRRQGTSGQLARALTIEDIRALAKRKVPRSVFDYVDGAAEDEISMRANRAAFDAKRFDPRVLRDVSQVDLTTTMLGERSDLPFALAPTGFTRMVHRDGEAGVAWAANKARIPYTLATLGTASPEQIAQLTPDTPRWFQLYAQKDQGANRALVDEVARHGYTALMVTVDTSVIGAKRRDIRSGLTIPPTVSARTFVNMAVHPSWWWNLLTTQPLGFESLRSDNSSLFGAMDNLFMQGIPLDFLAWLRDNWPGKLVVKGISSVDDARLAYSVGADAVVLSNHGGRQLDRTVPPIEVVRRLRENVGADAEILLDSGIRSGLDVAIAIASGANSCLIGRPYLYGVMAGGAKGVQRVIEILEAELRRTMQLLGVTSVTELTPDLLFESRAGEPGSSDTGHQKKELSWNY
jgi:L-lactate dehydrogenase (cytochrome)